jgi:membrane protease YdiL (CAAX protease family)
MSALPEYEGPIPETANTAAEVRDAEIERIESVVSGVQDPWESNPHVAGVRQGEQAPPAWHVPLFHSFSLPEVRSTPRIPHLGHVLLLVPIVFGSWFVTDLVAMGALRLHMFGISTIQAAETNIHYTLGTEALLYLLALAGCLLTFPPIWREGFFSGLHWHGATALHMRWRLVSAAMLCFALAVVSQSLLPGPTNAPIDKMFRTPEAAWLMFGFGITFAPFFEEMLYRGFLLPALCTACDWSLEQLHGESLQPLDENGNPQWSAFSMVIASVAVSIPFALMHGEQTGYGIGPFLLLVCVSLVLCWARLSTRSLAASVMVHSCYNFILFSLMLWGTGGFRHLDKT